MSEDKADPYDLLRRAKVILEQYDIESGQSWLNDFAQLPGADLSDEEIQVLRDPNRRCMGNMPIVKDLLERGFLMKVSQMRHGPWNSGRYIQIRLNKQGKEVLRLRGDVK